MSLATLQIDVKRTTQSRLPETDINNAPFGKVFSDHMFIAEYRDGKWQDMRVVPYGDMPMSPALSALHYGQSIFEGMKAHRADNGQVTLFRPRDNWRRMQFSARRMAMADLPEEIFVDGLMALLREDKGWVPDGEGRSLYLRPLYFATDDYIGVKSSENYMFIIISSPVGFYYPEPIKVLVETQYFRAVSGGVGNVKVSGNYGRSMYPTAVAKEKGYQQLIWTDSQNHMFVEESGTMNLGFVIDDVLITPTLGDTILAGITRDSVLQLARSWGWKVQERKIAVDELIEAHERGTLQEAFGLGTAATIAHISTIGYHDKKTKEIRDMVLPPVEQRSYSKKLGKALDDIRRGRIDDPFNWVMNVI